MMTDKQQESYDQRVERYMEDVQRDLPTFRDVLAAAIEDDEFVMSMMSLYEAYEDVHKYRMRTVNVEEIALDVMADFDIIAIRKAEQWAQDA